MKRNLLSFFKSFKYAIQGIVTTVKLGRNMRFHIVACVYVFCVAPFFLDSGTQWAVLALMCAVVIALETLNTAVEHVCNLHSTEFNPIIKLAKDASAGAVLISAVGAVVVAAVLFLHKSGFTKFINFCSCHVWYPIILIIMLVPAFLFVFFVGRMKRKVVD